MTTRKLFKENVYLQETEAEILKIKQTESEIALILDQTVFFPEGGGQSSDTGFINDIPLKNLYEKDGDIYHILDKNSLSDTTLLKTNATVKLKLNWKHRFDNMQRHCGEHILSGIFYREYGGVNRGFHMGLDYMTIDISMEENPQFTEITQEMSDRAELLANEVIWQNLPMLTSHFTTKSDAQKVPMRKTLTIEEDITLVGIGSSDNGWGCVACCGTHPSHTGEVGLIKIYKVEKNKGMFRIYFEAGRRCFENMQNDYASLNRLSEKLSAGREDILEKYQAQQLKQKEKSTQLHLLKKAVIDSEAEEILKNPKLDNFGYPIHKYDILTLDDLSQIGNKIASDLDKLAFLIHNPSNTVFLVSNGKIDCGKLVKDNAHIYNGKGGGNKTQSRAIFTKAEYVDIFIELIEKHLC